MRIWGLAAAGVLAAAGAASAQQPFAFRPIDPNKLVVQPADAAASLAGRTTSGTLRAFGRTVADVIEDNGFVRTINNVLGKRMSPPSVQAGYSALPLPSSYQSTRYSNAIMPVVPINSTFGQTPNVPLPSGSIVGR